MDGLAHILSLGEEFTNCLRNLSNNDLRELLLYFQEHPPMQETTFNFRQALNGTRERDHRDNFARCLVLLFDLHRLTNAQAVRTLVEREVVRRFYNLNEYPV